MLAIVLLGASFSAKAQKPMAAVLGIDSKGVINNSEAVSYMVRLELEKTNVYSILDKYDMAEMVKKNEIDIATCYGKSCVVAAGKTLGMDKMITGSVERFAEKIIISLKVIDVKTEAVEKQSAIEFQNLQPELQRMIAVSVQKLVGITPDQNIVNLLVNYEAPIVSPQTQIKLNGPRMGSSMAFGDAAKVLKAPQSEGGFNMYPANFQIGWQFEKQYISAGDFQALVEFFPMIGGLESGKFIPSATFLNGFRMGKAGWEFAFGPSFRIITKADGYFENDKENVNDGLGDKKWHLQNEWETGTNPNPGITRLDSRGYSSLSTSLFIGFGRTFKSGYLNIPVNIYVMPRKEGTIAGFSFGFNIYKKPKSI
ncbi:MAG: hypothetical protein ACKVQB_11600 [Bacteroidia bacterium]